ncbi:MAG TPA: hypothetical protein V6D10_00405 [Trichocoleus sp.]|jgi:hypothetical protein
MKADHILAIAFVAVLLFFVNHALSRADYCRANGQKTLNCVLQF